MLWGNCSAPWDRCGAREHIYFLGRHCLVSYHGSELACSHAAGEAASPTDTCAGHYLAGS